MTGIDWGLLLLLLNGLITVCWGIALIVFQTGIVPIDWYLSQYGQLHRGITNVIVTGVATISTSHLQFTVQNTVREYSALLVRRGFTLRQWAWMQEFARGSIWPPFTLKRHPVAWPLWLLVYGLMAAHSASLVAILQPRKSRYEFTRTFRLNSSLIFPSAETRWGHVMYNDPIPCGVDANTLTLNPNLTVLPDLDRVAEQIGLQLGNYYGAYLILTHPSNLLIISLLSQTKLLLIQPQQSPAGPL